jgi:hypothetical protein
MPSTWLATARSRGAGRELIAQLLARDDRGPATPDQPEPPDHPRVTGPADQPPGSVLAVRPTELRAVSRADTAWLP